jgi:hypothetical protein
MIDRFDRIFIVIQSGLHVVEEFLIAFSRVFLTEGVEGMIIKRFEEVPKGELQGFHTDPFRPFGRVFQRLALEGFE